MDPILRIGSETSGTLGPQIGPDHRHCSHPCLRSLKPLGNALTHAPRRVVMMTMASKTGWWFLWQLEIGQDLGKKQLLNEGLNALQAQLGWNWDAQLLRTPLARGCPQPEDSRGGDHEQGMDNDEVALWMSLRL